MSRSLELRTARPDELDALARLAASQQADPARFQAYFGEQPAEIALELGGIDAWEANTIVALYGDEIVGWVAAERDVEVGRIWWWGPVVAGDHDWAAVATPLFDEALERLAGGVAEFEFAVGDRHTEAISLALERGYRRDVASVILTRRTDSPHGRTDPPDGRTDPPDGGPADVRHEPSLSITTVGDEHRAAVAALHDEIFPGGHLNGRQLAHDLDGDDIVLVAVDTATVEAAGGRVIGYARAEIQHDDGGYLDFLGVTSDARGRGVGGALVAEVSRRLHATGVATVRLTVREDNLAARALYRRLDFDGSRLLVPLRLGFQL